MKQFMDKDFFTFYSVCKRSLSQLCGKDASR